MGANTIAVVGLGYVAPPLAVEFGKIFKTFGLGLSAEKVAACNRYEDPTGGIASDQLKALKLLTCSTDPKVIAEADFVVVAVPTPVDNPHQPGMTELRKASECVGRHLKQEAVIDDESTVYSGVTEEVCIPVEEAVSGDKERHPHAHCEGRGRRYGGNIEPPQGSLRSSDCRRNISGEFHQGGRGGEGHCEHAARPEYCADERAGNYLQEKWHRYNRSAESARYEVELLAVSAKTGWRPLRRHRPLLSDIPGRDAGLSSATSVSRSESLHSYMQPLPSKL